MSGYYKYILYQHPALFYLIIVIKFANINFFLLLRFHFILYVLLCAKREFERKKN